jgi:hypothetical protein
VCNYNDKKKIENQTKQNDEVVKAIGDDIIMPPSNRTPTSDAAARSIRPITGRLRTMVYEFIRSMGEHGATADEVELALAMRTPTCTARINELRNIFGVIKFSGRHRMTRWNHQAVVYIDAAIAIQDAAE